MSFRAWFALAVMVAAMLPALAARAQSDDARYTIMKPEPWLAPKYRSPRGTRQHVVNPPPAHVAKPRTHVPPPLYVPQTGRLLPNLPNPTPSGPNRRETFQDRAARCAHQAGVYGQAAGNRTSYINSCINQ